MSDVFVPGLSSRFDTEKLVEDMMRLQRIPRDRTENAINLMESQKTWWQGLGRQLSLLGDSARNLFSFQNPFNERVVFSSDDGTISATATREASEQSASFSVLQLAQADRFLSSPVGERTTVDAGNYVFRVGSEEISFTFRGGSLGEFADAVNRSGAGKVGANVVSVQPGTRSLLIESRLTGAENRLGFSGDAEVLARNLGMIGPAGFRSELAFDAETLREGGAQDGSFIQSEGTVELSPRGSARIPLELDAASGVPLVLRLQTATRIREAEEVPPPPGPDVPSSGSVSHQGITVHNEPSSVPLPENAEGEGPRVDDLVVFSLIFADGTGVKLPEIDDSIEFTAREYDLSQLVGGKIPVALGMDNANTHRDILVRDAVILDPEDEGGDFKALNAVSTAQDAIISMEGIRMTRPSNVIDDIIPGVTITARATGDRPVRLDVRTDRELVKESIIQLVGNYNRLMAELNVLTRNDPSLITELTYLSREESEEMKEKLGAFSGDSTLAQLRNGLTRATSSPFPTQAGRELSMLAQIGISTNARGTAGFDPTKLRGYLEIRESTLDAALENNLQAVRQLFGWDTTGNLIVDSGVAFTLSTISRPFVETGGIISLKTGTIDSRIRQDTQRLATIDRQLAAREVELRMQFTQMESAFSQMEQTSARFDSLNNSN
ncbi:MAG: flagellar filament capping protein FliD [Treponema sp.]|nr:flagellar filament capping protein FliD [Treponema sp.]